MSSNKFIILEASAGSGKTHNLAKRYISLLLNFDLSKTKPPLSNILALTFANKATVEMKERIIKYLKKISLGQDVKDVLTVVNVPKTKIPSNAYISVNNIINNFDHFNVRTIDSFINLIIKACALKLGVSPNYQILDSYEDYIDYSIDAFLDKSFTDKKIKSVLDTFFDQYIIDNSSSWNIRGNISETFKKLYRKEITKNIVEIKHKTKYSEELPNLNSDFITVCKEILKIKKIEELINSTLIKYINDVVIERKSLFTCDVSAYFLKENVPYLKNAVHNGRLDELYVEGKKIIRAFMEFKAKHYYDNYVKMFDSILNEFEKRAKLESVIFLQDINRQVSKVFYEQNLAPEIYLSLSNNFTDFLIDEFQDTNKIQWQTLKLIVEENLSKGGSFFYVGDKKQAIYGFRGGDYKIFDVPQIEFPNYNPKLTILNTNYRSCKAIVDFNNKLYSQENIAKLLNYITEKNNLNDVKKYCNDIIDVFKGSEQKCNRNESGYVEVSYKEYDKEDDVDEIVKKYLYETIDDVLKRFSNKDITVICRTNKEIEKIGKWLLEKNINIESFQTLNIINSQIVKELFGALQFFNMPIDNVAFVSFITSSIFLKRTNLSKEEVFNFITSESIEGNNNNLYTKFRNKYSEIWNNYIEEIFKMSGFVAVYEMAVSLISKYEVMENFKEYAHVIHVFLEIICDFEKTNQGLQNFIDYFKDFKKNERNEKFFIKVPSSNAIKITTMHKSKGLEFNVVIMPYLYIKPIGEKDNIFTIENEKEISFLKINKAMTAYSKYLKDIYYEKCFKNLSDELNGLYVSTTRAVCEFYGLIIHKKTKKNDKSFIEMFIDESTRKLGNKEKISLQSDKEDEEVINNVEIIPTKLQDIVDILNDNSTEIYGKKHKDILLNGKIIHYALSQIETFNSDNVHNKIEEAVIKTQNMYPNDDINWLKNKLSTLLSNKSIAALFNEQNAVFNEKEYVDKFGNTVRTDKIAINSNSVYIVDFKSSIYDKEYINNQMKKYLEILKDIYTNKKLCCYVVDIENEVLHNFNVDTGIE